MSERRPSTRRAGTATALVATVASLNVVGLVMVMSASAVTALDQYGSSWVFFQRQLLWAALGFAALVVMARLDYRRLRRLAIPLIVVSVVLLALVFVPGVGIEAGGARRWIGYGPFRLQPSELAKLALLIFAADLVVRRRHRIDDWREVLKPVLVVFAVLAVAVMRQPDMGTTVILAALVGVTLFAGGARPLHLGVLAGTGLLAGSVLALSAPYRRARVFAFLDPFSDAGNTGYQAVQSLIAFGSGGLFGVGLGEGRAKWSFLPNAHTDFIFSIIGEELGLVGALLVVGLFVALGIFGYRAATHAPDRFGFLLALGITVWIVVQAVVNIGAVLGLLPITGVPLPFVSAGGSALLFMMTATGVLVNIARQGRRPAAGSAGSDRSGRAAARGR